MDETDRAVEKAKKEIRDSIVNTTKKLAIQINQLVILSTPVDTGRARANWVATIGAPNSVKKDRTDKSGSATMSENNQVIFSANEPGLTIHISNNLEYIVPLNNGHSKQAPAGFVEKAVQVARNSIQ